MEDLQKELEEQREMAGNRLSELERLHQNHREVLQQLEYLKMDVSRRPIVSTIIIIPITVIPYIQPIILSYLFMY